MACCISPPPTDPAQAPWHFAPVGEGHDDATWTALFARCAPPAMTASISIEHEDPRYDGEEGTERSLAGLQPRARRLDGAPRDHAARRRAARRRLEVDGLERHPRRGARLPRHARARRAGDRRTGYQPNAIARSLKARTSTAIGIVVPDLTNPVLCRARRRRGARGERAGLCRARRPHGMLAGDRGGGGRALIERRVDGVIIAGMSLGSTLPTLLLDRGMPVVLASLRRARRPPARRHRP